MHWLQELQVGWAEFPLKELAAEGVHVAAVDVNEEGLNELKQESNNISIFPCDLSDSNAVKTMVQQVQSEVGSIDRVTQCRRSNANGKSGKI